MDWAFSNTRSYVKDISIGQFIEAARMNQYDLGWDIKLDLSPEDFDAWQRSAVLQAIFVTRCYWIAIRAGIAEFVGCVVCDLIGHELRDAGSYAGPDSAADHFTCSRCHKNFDHTYY